MPDGKTGNEFPRGVAFFTADPHVVLTEPRDVVVFFVNGPLAARATELVVLDSSSASAPARVPTTIAVDQFGADARGKRRRHRPVQNGLASGVDELLIGAQIAHECDELFRLEYHAVVTVTHAGGVVPREAFSCAGHTAFSGERLVDKPLVERTGFRFCLLIDAVPAAGRGTGVAVLLQGLLQEQVSRRTMVMRTDPVAAGPGAPPHRACVLDLLCDETEISVQAHSPGDDSAIGMPSAAAAQMTSPLAT